MDAKKRNLEELLNKIKDGAIQLPDFQRMWIWNDTLSKPPFAAQIILTHSLLPAQEKFSTR